MLPDVEKVLESNDTPVLIVKPDSITKIALLCNYLLQGQNAKLSSVIEEFLSHSGRHGGRSL